MGMWGHRGAAVGPLATRHLFSLTRLSISLHNGEGSRRISRAHPHSQFTCCLNGRQRRLPGMRARLVAGSPLKQSRSCTATRVLLSRARQGFRRHPLRCRRHAGSAGDAAGPRCQPGAPRAAAGHPEQSAVTHLAALPQHPLSYAVIPRLSVLGQRTATVQTTAGLTGFYFTETSWADSHKG